MAAATPVVIMGAAGRDFHNFNCLFRNDSRYRVIAFTAAQIPNIDHRVYPASLAGELYPEGIPILPEDELEQLIQRHGVEQVWFSYSDVSYAYVMERASRVIAWGAHFGVCSIPRTMLDASCPVIAVTAVRTGAGKSQTTRHLAQLLRKRGIRAVAVRHPMPYGDLAQQACQRFASYEDLDHHHTTIEEREEYEPYLDHGLVVYAGVDYHQILEQAQKEAQVILWDGGNNDAPFYRPDLQITVLDPHRAGDETSYYPGESNLLMADVLLINKVDTAPAEGVQAVLESCRRLNPDAEVLQCRSKISVAEPEKIRGKRAVVVEDGPTLTHGGMSRGAGWYAARQAGAAEIVDPRPYAVGSIAETYEKYPNAAGILPAMGYSESQIADLLATLEAVPADVIVEGTPIELRRLIEPSKPIADVRYDLEVVEPGRLEARVEAVLARLGES
jgi:predicted GTPase